jgi:hypothetical protein
VWSKDGKDIHSNNLHQLITPQTKTENEKL